MSFDTIPASNYLTGLELKAAQKSVAMPLFRLVQAEMLWNESLDAAYLCMSRAAAYLKGLPAREIRPILGAAGYYIYKQTLRTDLSRPSPTTTQYVSHLTMRCFSINMIIALNPLLAWSQYFSAPIMH